MPRRPPALLALALALLAGACASPLGGRDLHLGAAAVWGPRLGGEIRAAQLALERPRFDVLVEASVAHESLDPAVSPQGERVDEGWDQVQAGLAIVTDPRGDASWVGRAGVVWLRAQGDPVVLDAPLDYGGGYLGIGRLHRLNEHLSTGPELTLLGVLPEGSGDAGGVVPQLAWRLVWRL
ncbi:MAG: hypothetical protein AB1726_15625 [Planctomycetota bacterium]